ncbi:hypothetical protein MMC07_003003 [Pseudocyphellaria aurata]|nr:hypothetical protein [Pseudocyphellaria aurata]
MEQSREKNVVRQLEQEFNVEILPGTEVMIDSGNHHFVKASASSDRVLVPQPSNDPSDPLNWNKYWKASAMICATASSFTQGLGPLSLAPMIPQLIEAFHSDLAGVLQFTGIAILVLGFSNFIWVPITTAFGRRPVLLATLLVSLGSSIWRARAQSYASFMGASVLNGIGCGSSETLQPVIIADVFFLHDRGAYNTVYFAAYFGALMASCSSVLNHGDDLIIKQIGPIIAGSMADHVGWRNFWWFNVACLAVTFIISLVGFPETKWDRSAQERPNSEHSPEGKVESADAEKQGTIEVRPELSYAATAANDPFLGEGKPNKQQFKLFQSNAHPFRSIFLELWIPWKLFAFPIVEFASFVVSWSASSFLTLNLTQSEVFAAPPYNFSSESIGFMNFAILVGAIIGLVTAGPLSDWVSMRATRKNNGIREPEMRLPTMIPYVIIMIIGNFVVAFGYQHQWDWKIIVIIGFTCAGIQVAALPAITSTYAVDSYKPVAGSIFVAITVNKNLWGYGYSKFITPWILSDGYIPPIMTNMSLITLWSLSGILFWWKGKTFRRWTRNSMVHRM